MSGYSDRINHAFAFAAKHYGALRPAAGGMGFLAHPSNVAVILARYGAEPITIVAGIVHHILEALPPAGRPEMEQKIGNKFGPVALAIACDAVEPTHDPRGMPRSWGARKQEYLTQLAAVEPRALDICVADEIHAAGSTVASVSRLGPEYLRAVAAAPSEQWLWWSRSLIDVLEDRRDWPRREMLAELRLMSADLVRTLRSHETEDA